MVRGFQVLVLAAMVGIVLWGLARATTVVGKTLDELVAESDTIAVGIVIAIETAQEQETPVTLVTFSDLDILKGDAHQKELTVQMLGGPAPDGRRLTIVGAPVFHLGDRVVVFIVGNETQAVPFVGMWQGVYRVVYDTEQDTEVIATHDGRPLTALPSPEPFVHYDDLIPYQAQRRAPLTLDFFRRSIAERERNRHVPLD